MEHRQGIGGGLIPPACFDVNGTLWFHEHSVKLIPCESFSKKLKLKTDRQGVPLGSKCPNAKEMYFFLSVLGMYCINFKKIKLVIFS